MKPQLVLHLHKALELKRNQNKEGFDDTYACFVKKDGNYCYMDVLDNQPDLIMSRTQKPFESLAGHETILIDQINSPYHHYRVIMEVVVKDVDFHTGNGILNRSIGNCVLEFDKVTYYIHDVVNLRNNSLTFKQRYLDNRDYLAENVKKANVIFMIPFEFYSKFENLFNLGTWLISQGEEGLVAKNINSRYEPGKRTQNMVKVKIEEEVALTAKYVEFTRGDKGNEGCVLVCSTPSGVKQAITVNDQTDRDVLANNFYNVIEKSIKVNCMAILPSGKLREPRLTIPLHAQLKEFL